MLGGESGSVEWGRLLRALQGPGPERTQAPGHVEINRVCGLSKSKARRGECDAQVHQGLGILGFLVSCLLRAALSQHYARHIVWLARPVSSP